MERWITDIDLEKGTVTLGKPEPLRCEDPGWQGWIENLTLPAEFEDDEAV